jgi:tRNA(Arg) A34 adenosine deaminase TadA
MGQTMAPPFPLPFPMRRALDLARLAQAAGEVPIGAVVTRHARIIGEGENRNRRDNDPTAHAEIVDFRLNDCDLWVTLEPCPMCAGAISHARIARLYYAASDPKGGAVEQGPRLFAHPQCLHRPQIYGGLAEGEASALLRSFFAARR